MNEDTLVERLKQQINTGGAPSEEYDFVRQHANPPITMATLIEAEAKLGFSLPPLLKRIYCEVGNGGFGPGYGLFKLTLDLSVDDKHDNALIDTYLALHPIRHQAWSLSPGKEGAEFQHPIDFPEQVLMLCDWGCSIQSFLDCSSSEYRILRKDHNYSMTDHALECPSFHQWLEAWLAGVPLFYSCFRETWERAPKVMFYPSPT